MVENQKDYYKILEVTSEATEIEIKKSFKRLAMKYHPDKNPDNKEAEEQFKLINEAYDILSDSEKRSNYDNGPNLMGLFNMPFAFRSKPDFKKIPRPGKSLSYFIDIPLYMFILGGEYNLDVQFEDICVECSGLGFETSKKCQECSGVGHKLETIKRPGFYSQSTIICGRCRGMGEIPDVKCSACEGRGIKVKSLSLLIPIPKNVHEGHTLVERGKAGTGINGAPNGDIHLRLRMILPTEDSLSEHQIQMLKEM